MPPTASLVILMFKAEEPTEKREEVCLGMVVPIVEKFWTMVWSV